MLMIILLIIITDVVAIANSWKDMGFFGTVSWHISPSLQGSFQKLSFDFQMSTPNTKQYFIKLLTGCMTAGGSLLQAAAAECCCAHR